MFRFFVKKILSEDDTVGIPIMIIKAFVQLNYYFANLLFRLQH